jgi:hypothetical protein
MGRSAYEWLWPLVRLVPSELAHELGLLALRAPLRWGGAAVEDPFEWRGHRFRNRVGIAAGLDKNGVALRGLAALGAGFIELGTVLARPHPGNAVRPRMRRLLRERALWNRLGFPSQGAARVRDRIARAPLADVALAVNLAPHPLTVKSAESETGFAGRARAELFEIARLLHPWAAFFVLNASAPNTPGLRRQLEGGGFAQEIVAAARSCCLDAGVRRIAPTHHRQARPGCGRRRSARRPGAREAVPVAGVATASSRSTPRCPGARAVRVGRAATGGVSGAAARASLLEAMTALILDRIICASGWAADGPGRLARRCGRRTAGRKSLAASSTAAPLRARLRGGPSGGDGVQNRFNAWA